LPLGVVVSGATGPTVALKVTFEPAADGFSEELIAVAEEAGVISRLPLAEPW
jgi:hypothetical protein